MLQLMGKGYILQHCRSVRRQEFLELSYKAYMTDALASLAGAEERWADRVTEIIDPHPAKPQQTAEEVIAHIKNGLNGGDDN